jgi:hypothetical protein
MFVLALACRQFAVANEVFAGRGMVSHGYLLPCAQTALGLTNASVGHGTMLAHSFPST